MSSEEELQKRVAQLESELEAQKGDATVDVAEEEEKKDEKSGGVSMTHVAIAAAVIGAFVFLVMNAPSKSYATVGMIILSSVVCFAFGMYWWKVAEEIIIEPGKGLAATSPFLTDEIMDNVKTIAQRVSEGATAFLFAEYRYMAVFMGSFGILLYILLGVSLSNPTNPEEAVPESPWTNAGLSVFAFMMGSCTSILSGWIGMRIAVFTNCRTAVMATDGADKKEYEKGYSGAFETAFRGGITMGFCLTSLGIFSLLVTIGFTYSSLSAHPKQLYECVAAFGLGGSAIACFGRVGGGIFTKAADVGADLVGKVEKNIPEDDKRNPGVIADCIGDNVGDIAGMGSDLFGSFGEASCAALVVAAGSAELSSSFTAMMYPLMITAAGTVVCMLTAYMTAVNCGVKKAEDIEPILKKQLIMSTVGSTAALYLVTMYCLPETFVIGTFHTTRMAALVCVYAGLWTGLLIGFTTEYYTSCAYEPVQEIAESCETGAATCIIYGLALGYMSVLAPTAAMAVTIFVAYNMCGLYGYALAALGMLSTMAIALTIDAYGPISDNAGGFAEMADMGSEIRDITDALDAAGNTTAAIGKGFAIGSAAFVGLALYGAYISRAQIKMVNIFDERVLPGLVVGAMLPYWFSAMTMKSVGIAAMAMVSEIRRQFRNPKIADGTQAPDYERCVAIATEGSLKQMIAPGMLVIFSPIVCGILFGKYTLAGLLPGALVSGVQMAISASNTGGAWDNAKKFIEAGGLKSTNGKGKGTPQHAAAVVGDTVGDPLKDTSGPALNILIKLMAIISVVFTPVVQSSLGGILLKGFKHQEGL
jgi:H+-translocating diphosphatase